MVKTSKIICTEFLFKTVSKLSRLVSYGPDDDMEDNEDEDAGSEPMDLEITSKEDDGYEHSPEEDSRYSSNRVSSFIASNLISVKIPQPYFIELVLPEILELISF